MNGTEDIVTQLRESTGFRGDIDLDSTLQVDLGVWGDDMDEVLSDYSERFHVDMKAYRWYFHTREEGQNFGSLFFRSPSDRVSQIPITVRMLKEFADSGTWSVAYPEHEFPQRRLDLILNQIIGLAVLVALAAWLLVKWMN
jgi:hypothetical protein